MNKVYTFILSPDWKLIAELGQIDTFAGKWSAIEKRESKSLRELKSIATVRSVGASTRIEGSKMTDDEVQVLINRLSIATLEERDQQEVVGYFETLDLISASFTDIEITAGNIKHLHNLLMKHSKKDEWHKGNYKQHSNVVEATNPDESKYVVFQTTAPGFQTEEAMSNLIEWYNADTDTHPVVRSALFVYDFLSIHPFQDGNGRLSRLLATLLLLRHGYSWVQYVSFEHEIESRKGDYYKVLMQRQRPGEDVYTWVTFFLECLNNIQKKLVSKLAVQGSEAQMSVKEKMIYAFVVSHPGCSSGDIAEKLGVPLPTVKKMLTAMVSNKLLIRHGAAKGTNYTI
jgi:Fic family protein